MIVVDKAVWVDYFTANRTEQVSKLDSLLGEHPVGTSELIYTDVLRGFLEDRDFDIATKLFALLTQLQMVTPGLALKAAQNSRQLRSRGISISSTSDLLTGTFCVENGYPLLYAGKNFVHFEAHLGLTNAMTVENTE
jgi:hypothetical protein